MEKHNPILKGALLDTVEKQLRSSEVPEVKETYNRLTSEGYSPKQAKELIATVLTTEIFFVQKNKRVFDKVKYVKALNRLPELPYDDYEC